MSKKVLKAAGIVILILIIGRVVTTKTAQQIEKRAVVKEKITTAAILGDMTEALSVLEAACQQYRAEHGDWPDGKSALKRNKDYLPEGLGVNIKNDHFYFGTNKVRNVIYHIHAFPKDRTKRYNGYDGFMLYYFDTAADGDWETKKYGCSKSGSWTWSRDGWPF